MTVADIVWLESWISLVDGLIISGLECNNWWLLPFNFQQDSADTLHCLAPHLHLIVGVSVGCRVVIILVCGLLGLPEDWQAILMQRQNLQQSLYQIRSLLLLLEGAPALQRMWTCRSSTCIVKLMAWKTLSLRFDVTWQEAYLEWSAADWIATSRQLSGRH